MLVIPKFRHYREILGRLNSKTTMNLKCGACHNCSGGGNSCNRTGVRRIVKTPEEI